MFRLLYIIQHFFKHFGEPLNSRYGLRSNDGILLSHPNFETLTTLGDRAVLSLLQRQNFGTIYLQILEWLNLLTLLKNF